MASFRNPLSTVQIVPLATLPPPPTTTADWPAASLLRPPTIADETPVTTFRAPPSMLDCRSVASFAVPPLIEESWPEASFVSPPEIDARLPEAWFPAPPVTLAVRPLAVLSVPPVTLAASPEEHQQGNDRCEPYLAHPTNQPDRTGAPNRSSRSCTLDIVALAEHGSGTDKPDPGDDAFDHARRIDLGLRIALRLEQFDRTDQKSAGSYRDNYKGAKVDRLFVKEPLKSDRERQNGGESYAHCHIEPGHCAGLQMFEHPSGNVAKGSGFPHCRGERGRP